MSSQPIHSPRIRRPKSGMWLTAPAVLWLLAFLILPMVMVLAMSLMSRDELGEPSRPWTWENFQRLAGMGAFGFDPLYPKLIITTMVLAGLSTFTALILALPLAFAIASLPKRWRNSALILVIVPMWVNLVVRTYAWQLILGANGFVSTGLRALGWMGAEEGIYPGMTAVWIGLICDYLPFLVLPIYASVEKMDPVLVEAGRDLGARGWSLFRHTVWPQIKPGVAAAVLLTWIPATGQFLIPDLLGGGKTMLLGNALQQQFGGSSDWPFGAAITVMFLGLAGGIVLLHRWIGSGAGEGAKQA